MNASAKFWDKVADGYAKQPIADEAAYQKKLQITRDYLQPRMNMLEFGCGTGSTALAPCPLCAPYSSDRFFRQDD
jgi:cyclopropane fatty-acyl-phospholipid synthase-like methyltransferase